MKSIIKIQYTGSMRLLLKRKEDIFEFLETPTLADIIEDIKIKYGEDLKKECLKQMFLLNSPEYNTPKQLSYPKDKDIKIKNGNLVKIMSFITGG